MYFLLFGSATVETAGYDCSLIYGRCVFANDLPTVLFAVLLCIFTVLFGVTFLYIITSLTGGFYGTYLEVLIILFVMVILATVGICHGGGDVGYAAWSAK